MVPKSGCCPREAGLGVWGLWGSLNSAFSAGSCFGADIMRERGDTPGGGRPLGVMLGPLGDPMRDLGDPIRDRGVPMRDRGVERDPRGVRTLVLGLMLERGVRKGVPPMRGDEPPVGALRGLRAGLEAVADIRSFSRAACLHPTAVWSRLPCLLLAGRPCLLRIQSHLAW